MPNKGVKYIFVPMKLLHKVYQLLLAKDKTTSLNDTQDNSNDSREHNCQLTLTTTQELTNN